MPDHGSADQTWDAQRILLRQEQEREVQLTHALAAAEFALAREAFAVSRTFAEVGLDFDPVTFVVLRVLDASASEYTDPGECLHALSELGTLDRSIELAAALLDEAA